MTATLPVDLLLGFLLAMVRTAAWLVVCPPFATRMVPITAKVGLAVALAVPLGLVAFSRTRRFGAYMLVGVVVTALVVAGAASLVLWLMVQRDI